MADNVAFTPGTGATGATDDVGGVHYPRVKVVWGPDGTVNDADVASGKPIPAQLRVSDGTAWTYGAGSVTAGTPRVTHASDDPLVTLVTGVAHDAADSGNASKIGARAKGALSGITLVSADDRTDIFAGLDGVQIARPHCPLEDLVSAVVACTSGANTSAVGAQGANIKFYLCGGMLYNNGSSNGACLITDGNGGTTKLKVPFAASTGTVFTLPVPIGFSANTAVYADPSGSDTIDVTLYGFKSKV